MDRAILTQEKTGLFKQFEYIDLIPYTIAVMMILAEIYIVHQFTVVTSLINY